MIYIKEMYVRWLRCVAMCVVEPRVTGVRVAGLGAYESSDDSGDEREDTSDQQLQVRTELLTSTELLRQTV